MWSRKNGEIFHKREDISESVSSFHIGPIFLASLGQELSRNAFVVSILFPGRNLSMGKDFFMTPKTRDFHDFSTFLESSQGASGKGLGCFGSVPGHFDE